MKIARYIEPDWHHYCVQYHDFKPFCRTLDDLMNADADRKFSYLATWDASKETALALEEKIRSHMKVADHVYVDFGEPLLHYKAPTGGDYHSTPHFINKFNKESIKQLFMNEYLYRVDKNMIIGKEHKSELVEILQKLPDIFDVSEFKEASNLSRKYAIPYLEFLDKCLYTSKINSSGKRKKLV